MANIPFRVLMTSFFLGVPLTEFLSRPFFSETLLIPSGLLPLKALEDVNWSIFS